MNKLLLLCLMVGLSIHFFAQSIVDGLVIKDIQFKGIVKSDRSEISRLIGIEKNDIYDQAIVDRSIKNLYELEAFQFISTSYRLEETQLVLIYQFTEKPYISKLSLKGNQGISKTDVSNKLSNETRAFYKPYELTADITHIMDTYKQKGFVGTLVEAHLEPLKGQDKEQTNKGFSSGEVELIFQIYEGKKLMIQNVQFQGNKLISNHQLQKSLKFVKPPKVFNLIQSPFLPETLDQEITNLTKTFQSEGFINFKVKSGVINIQLNPNKMQSDLENFFSRMHISLKKYQIKSWIKNIMNQINTFSTTIPDQNLQDLEKILQTENKETLNIITKTIQNYMTSILELRNRIQILTKSNFDVQVKWNSNVAEGYFINFIVEEGNQYIFGGNILLNTDNKPTEKFMDNNTFLKTGDIFDLSLQEKFEKNLGDYYRDMGFFATNIQKKIVRDEKSLSVKNELIITPGNLFHIENIYVRGNKKTKNYVIDRELAVRSGQIYNQSQVLQTYEKLSRSGYFDNVEVMPQAGSDEDLANLVFKVSETNTGTFSFGGGYGTESGFSVYADLTENNFLGSGIKFGVKGQYGETQRYLQLSTSSDYIYYTPIYWSMTVGGGWYRYYSTPRYDRDHNGVWDKIVDKESDGNYEFIQEGDDPDFDYYYDEDRDGSYPGTGDFILDETDVYGFEERYFEKMSAYTSFSLGYRLVDYLYLSLGQGYGISKYANPHNINVDAIYEDDEYRLKSDLLSEEWYFTSSISLQLRYDTKNSFFTPTKGVSIIPRVEFVGFAGGYDHFTKLSLTASGYLSLIDIPTLDILLVWANGLEISSIGPFPGYSNPILRYEHRLEIDPSMELRGWESLYGDDSLNGLGKITFGSELRSPIPGTNRLLWLGAFFDMAKVSDDSFSLPLDFQQYYYSVGFGLRLEFNSFPIRFYFAQPLKWDTKKHWFSTLGGLNFSVSVAGKF